MHPPSKLQQPWHIDPNLYPGLVEKLSQGQNRFLISGTQKDWDTVQALYSKNPVKGQIIAKVEVIYNETMLVGFEARLQELEDREGNSAFSPKWLQDPNQGERQVVHTALKGKLLKKEGYPHVKVVAMFHGTAEVLIPSILKTNFANISETDVGFFGKGLYFTSDAKYANLYAIETARKTSSTPCLLYNFISFFADYPVIPLDFPDKIAGKGNQTNHDAHYTLVAPPSGQDDDWYCIPSQNSWYDELTVFQSNQVLAHYVVTLSPNGLTLKTLTAINTIADLVKALGQLSQAGTITVKTSFQKLREKLTAFPPDDPLTSEQNWLLALVMRLNSHCLSAFKSQVTTQLHTYFTLQEDQVEREQKLIATIRAHYLTKNRIPGLLGGVRLIEESYTELAIVQQELNEVTTPSFRDARISGWEKMRSTKKAIPLDKLFEKGLEEIEPKRLLLVGRAGVGKSTLCHHIAFQWSTGKLWNDRFAALIWLPLRALKTFKGENAVAFVSEHCGATGIDPFDLSAFLQQNKEKVLFLLDGYDEAQFAPGTKEWQILQALLGNPCWLVTSRPYATHSLQADRLIENMGFNDSHVQDYVSKALSWEKAQSLKMHLQHNRWLAGISYTPLNLELICHLWSHQGPPLLEAMTGLYRKCTHELQCWYLKKIGLEEVPEGGFETIDPQFARISRFLEELAWKALEGQSLLFSFQDPQLYALYEAHLPEDKDSFHKILREIGFLQCSGSVVPFLTDIYSFSHLTFQEFFASRYLARMFQESPDQVASLIQSQKFNPRFQVVFWFVAGLLKENPAALQTLFDSIDTPADLVGFYGFQLRAHCLEECGWPDHLLRMELYLREAKYWCRWLFKASSYGLVKEALFELFQYSSHLRQQLLPVFHEERARGSLITEHQILAEMANAWPEIGKEVVSILLLCINNVNKGVPFTALEALSKTLKLYPELEETILPGLQKALQNREEGASDTLRGVMEALPGIAKKVVQNLEQDLRDRDFGLGKPMVAIAVEAQPELKKKAVAVLRQMMQAANPVTSRVFVAAMQIEPQLAEEMVPRLLQFLKEADSVEKSRDLLGLIGGYWSHYPETIQKRVNEVLKESLKHPDSRIWATAKYAIKMAIQSGSESSLEFVPLLTQLLKEGKTSHVSGALRELVILRPEMAKEIGPLLLQQPIVEQETGQLLVDILRSMPERANEALPILRQIFSEGVSLDPQKKHLLIEAMHIVPSLAKMNLRWLLSKLQDQNPATRKTAAIALEEAIQVAPEIGREVISSLLQASEDEHEGVRAHIIKTLGKVLQAWPASIELIVSHLLKQERKPYQTDSRIPFVQLLCQAVRLKPEILNPEIIKECSRFWFQLREDFYRAMQAVPALARAVAPHLLEGVKSSSTCADLNLEALSHAVKAAPDIWTDIAACEQIWTNCQKWELLSQLFSASDRSRLLSNLLVQELNPIRGAVLSDLKSLSTLLFILTKCVHESIPVFVRENCLCLYASGLQQTEIDPTANLASLIWCFSDNYRHILHMGKIRRWHTGFFGGPNPHYLKGIDGRVNPLGTVSIALMTMEPSSLESKLIRECIQKGAQPDTQFDTPYVHIEEQGTLQINLSQALSQNQTFVTKLQLLGLAPKPANLERYSVCFQIPREQVRSFLNECLHLDSAVYKELCLRYPVLSIAEEAQHPFASQSVVTSQNVEETLYMHQ